MQKSQFNVDENLLNEALNLSIKGIFGTKENGNDFLTPSVFGRKQQSFDRVKELLPIECINLGNVTDNGNSKNHDVVEELITILNGAFKHSDVMLDKLNVKRPKNLGEQGQREYLLTKYLGNIESRILREFIKTKKRCKPYLILTLINRVMEYEKLVSRRLNKSAGHLTEEELSNSKLMESMVTSSASAALFSQLYSFLNDTNKVAFSHQIKEQQRIDHPIVNQFTKDLQRRNRSTARIEKIDKQVKKLFKWLPVYREFEDDSINEISVWQITRDHLLEYKSFLIRQSKIGVLTKYTCKQHFKDIKTFFKRIYELNIVNEDIGFGITNIKANDYFYRKLPNDNDIQDLFTAVQIYSEEPDKDSLAIAFNAFLGFRIIELHRIEWKDINLSTKTLVVHSKGNKDHLLPIPDIIYKMLFKVLKENRVGFLFRKSPNEKENSFNSRIDHAFKLYKVLADWDFEGGPHLLRHWYITNLARLKIEPADIKTLARHDSLKTTAKYIHYYTTELQDAVNKIDYGVRI